MVGTNAVEVSVMTESPETDLNVLKQEVESSLSQAVSVTIEEKDIAFGLKALKVVVAWPENIDTDEIENLLSKISGVSSCKIEDIRRAFG